MNELTKQLGIHYPILQGGMGNISHAKLAAAISTAGGLGTIGAGTMTAKEVKQMIMEVKSQTDQSFCVNIPVGVQPYVKEIVQCVITHHVPVVSLSAGNPKPFIPLFHEHGMKVICVVASVKQAIKAEQAGADVIVAEGYEAAGINSHLETTTLTLIPQVVKAVSIPVVAAGGIACGRGLAAMFALGASGVQMGTRLIATKEAQVASVYKKQLVEATDESTVIVGRSVGRHRRLLKTPYATFLQDREKTGVTTEQFDILTNEDHHILGAIEGEIEQGHLNSGQIAGLIDDVPTVKELFSRMMDEAEQSFLRSMAFTREMRP